MIATHLIKIKGTFNECWTEERIEELVDEKINNEIDKIYHANLEKFQINGSDIEVWVLIIAFPSEVTKKVVTEWFKEHIKEEGITVKDFVIREIAKIGSMDSGIRITMP